MRKLVRNASAMYPEVELEEPRLPEIANTWLREAIVSGEILVIGCHFNHVLAMRG